MKNYYGYIRVSTVKQGEQGVSLHEQRDAISRYAQRNGLEVSDWFEEIQTAAKRGRPGFNRMLKLLKQAKASGVVIHKIDRSARNLKDWADLGELIDQGIEVHFANESLDLHSRGGRLSADIQAVVASDYIRNLREETRKGFYGRLKQGIYPLPAPLGYLDMGKAKPKELDPAKAPLVKKVFELYGTGQYNLEGLTDKLYVMANESYEDFARALQTEYEEDCGVTFGKVPLTALAKIIRVVDGVEQPIGREDAEVIRLALVEQKMLDSEGHIQPGFDPKKKDFKLELPEVHRDLAPAVLDLLSAYQIERHIHKEKDEGQNRLKKEVQLSPEFQALWNRIKPKTTYRVEFETENLVQQAVDALKRMEKIEIPKIQLLTGQVDVTKGGVTGRAVSAAEESASLGNRLLPDILAYLQNETELTRSTLVRILKESGRLGDFFNNPQRFMDAVAAILKYELHRLIVDGIKYERLPGDGPEAEWEQTLFKSPELINYLNALQVKKSVYEYVVYESDVERQFAKRLDEREDIKLFVKLPGWFEVETPVGKYNPDWAILKHDDQALYLVRETKGTKDFLKLRTSEADKVRCGRKHFEAIDVPFAVVVTADEV